MRAHIVKSKQSRLSGARCRICPRPIRPGETVLYQHIPEVEYGENRFVVHADCIQAVLDAAPAGRTPGDPKAQFFAKRRELIAALGAAS